MTDTNRPDPAGDEEADALWNEMAAAKTASLEPTPEAADGIEVVQDEANAPSNPPANAGGSDNDIWSTVPPEVRAAHEEAQRKIQSLELAVKRDRGQISALQRKYQEVTSRPAPEDDPWAEPVIRKVAEEYPEVVAPIIRQTADLHDRLARIEQQSAHREASTVEQEAERVLDTMPTIQGWRDVFRTHGAKFEDWKATQPLAVREAAERNANGFTDPDDAALVIERFMRDMTGNNGRRDEPPRRGNSNPLADRRQRQLETSTGARARGPSFSPGQPAATDEDAYWNQLAAAKDAENARRG